MAQCSSARSLGLDVVGKATVIEHGGEATDLVAAATGRLGRRALADGARGGVRGGCSGSCKRRGHFLRKAANVNGRLGEGLGAVGSVAVVAAGGDVLDAGQAVEEAGRRSDGVQDALGRRGRVPEAGVGEGLGRLGQDLDALGGRRLENGGGEAGVGNRGRHGERHGQREPAAAHAVDGLEQGRHDRGRHNGGRQGWRHERVPVDELSDLLDGLSLLMPAALAREAFAPLPLRLGRDDPRTVGSIQVRALTSKHFSHADEEVGAELERLLGFLWLVISAADRSRPAATSIAAQLAVNSREKTSARAIASSQRASAGATCPTAG